MVNLLYTSQSIIKVEMRSSNNLGFHSMHSKHSVYTLSVKCCSEIARISLTSAEIWRYCLLHWKDFLISYLT